MSNGTSYFDEIMRRKLICGELAGQKLGILIKLTALSAKGFSKPRACGSGDGGSRGSDGIPAIVHASEFLVERLAILNHVRDDDELRFVDYYSRFNSDILTDLDDGRIEFKNTKSILNSALGDIAREINQRRDHGK